MDVPVTRVHLSRPRVGRTQIVWCGTPASNPRPRWGADTIERIELDEVAFARATRMRVILRDGSTRRFTVTAPITAVELVLRRP
jgi:hypothetical protein